jgi:hypothetical protein
MRFPLTKAPALLGVAALLGACGGEDRGRPDNESISAAELERCAADDGYVFAPITTFDSAAASGVVECSDGDFPCSFWFNYDTAHSQANPERAKDQGTDCALEIHEGDLVTSPPTGDRLVREVTTRCGEQQGAYHFVADNLAMCKGKNGRRGWGGAQDITLNGLDASAFDGFSFWAKKGEGETERSIIALAVDPYTSGQLEIVNPFTGVAEGCDGGEPDTTSETPEDDFSKCDPFAAGVTLDDEWTFIAVHFADLRQKGFGMPSPEALQTQALVRLQFLVTAGDWDFWLDDVAFFREPQRGVSE